MQEKLLVLRNRKGLSIKQMADLIGVGSKTYSLKEKGLAEFTQDEMFVISSFFSLKVDQIFLPRKHQNGAKN